MTAVDLDTVFAECPQYIDYSYLDALPVYVLLDLAVSDNPCDAAELLLSSLVFEPPPFDGLEGDQFVGIIDECPLEAQALDRFLDVLAGVDLDLAQRVQASVTPNNRCALGRAVIDRVLPPLSYSEAYALPRDVMLKLRRAFTSDDMVKIGATICLTYQSSQMIAAVADRLNQKNLSPADLQALGGDMCPVIFKVQLLGDFSVDEQALYDTLINVCGFKALDTSGSVRDATRMLENVIAGGADSRSIRAAIEADPQLCDSIAQVVTDYTPNPNTSATSPDVPPSLAQCPELARLLKNSLGTGYLYQWLLIFHSTDPCVAAYRYLYEGKSSVPPGKAAILPDCLDDWNTLRLADGTRLTSQSEWYDIWRYLDRPLDQICEPLDPDVASFRPPDAQRSA